ncbi:MAG: stage V sporulation protein AD [Christensenellales bacterium]|jgi:stage V sporulation protein AD
MSKKIGTSTYRPACPPSIISWAAIAGEVEAQGPLRVYFDQIVDEFWGEDSAEKAECKMFVHAVKTAMKKGNVEPEEIDILLGGDLLNQIISVNFAALQLGIPFLGLYGACSTMAESLLNASMIIDGGFAKKTVCVTGSHYSTAERQYRMPLEMGGQTTPTAQRTVTGVGACVLSDQGAGPYVTSFTIGTTQDYGIKDAANMGAAMAPAAIDTLDRHFKDMGRKPDYYDIIATGDLGKLGYDIVIEKMADMGYDMTVNYTDCGIEIFDLDKQNVDCGGSGCGCCATVLNGYLLDKMEAGVYKKILLVPTGALLSTTSTLQGESIPCIAHAVAIEKEVGV